MALWTENIYVSEVLEAQDGWFREGGHVKAMEDLSREEKTAYLRAWDEEKPTIDNIVQFVNKQRDVVECVTIPCHDSDQSDLLTLCAATTLMIRYDQKLHVVPCQAKKREPGYSSYKKLFDEATSHPEPINDGFGTCIDQIDGLEPPSV